MRTKLGLFFASVVISCLTFSGTPAAAGCGCDHPPPDLTVVQPPFASPGSSVVLNAVGFSFEVGESYGVEFDGAYVDAVADTLSALRVEVPSYVAPGPVRIRVEGPGVDHEYDSSAFTALAPAPVIPPGSGDWFVPGFPVAVAQDGTLLIPFNLEQVLDATQFGIAFRGISLEFGPDDVVFFNRDGVDLTLFTLAVADETERQWGSYYGWDVQQDGEIFGTVFNHRTGDLDGLGALFQVSDLLTYWRHEFHTYADAHKPGRSHEVDANGFHRGVGTRHVNHDHLVLAIAGAERHGDELRALDPGAHWLTVQVHTEVAGAPVEPDAVRGQMRDAILSGLGQLMELEAPSVYFDDDDDDDDDDD